ncbi:restriction endonuclease [Spirochaeta thermophila DSM 6578]|uniref:Restriction endonuclease n=1 Tax=Winmispira thermophila (strain ATCC 700085 / DSM 6578 / Z-1203) TaxID=869211 RepID=G0GDD8_WINT7|nr:tetratricopeptide repeat protein [Spirochaeta thermophila]AEJ60564.1 restriction endonuclease [Spirochaeta thermophila DSM 6578]
MGALPLLLPAAIVLIGLVILAVYFNLYVLSDPEKKAERKKRRDRQAILKKAQRRLAQNPRDPEALVVLAEAYFEDQEWEKALKLYQVLAEGVTDRTKVDEYEVQVRRGVCAFRLGRHEEAYQAFAVAYSLKPEAFEVRFHMGALEYLRGAYEHAVKLLSAAAAQQPEHPETRRYLSLALHRSGKYKEALPSIRAILNEMPDDKELLFAYADCLANLGQKEQALSIFTHLRVDEQWGPQACFRAGLINLGLHRYERAIKDLEIGVRHRGMDNQLRLEMEYRLAQAYIHQKEIRKAVEHLRAVQRTNPHYKDVEALLKKYGELQQNQNLQTYLLASPPDFLTLCRKLVVAFFPGAYVRILNMSIERSEYADLLCEVETSQWQDTVLFRFVRTTGTTGELAVRDFHARLKETRADRGICVSAGSFSDEAKRFVEARLIDLVGKEDLMGYLRKVDSLNPV